MTEKEVTSCIQTIELLKKLAYNIHGVMDVIDYKNCEKIINLLKEQANKATSEIGTYTVYRHNCERCGYEWWNSKIFDDKCPNCN